MLRLDFVFLNQYLPIFRLLRILMGVSAVTTLPLPNPESPCMLVPKSHLANFSAKCIQSCVKERLAVFGTRAFCSKKSTKSQHGGEDQEGDPEKRSNGDILVATWHTPTETSDG